MGLPWRVRLLGALLSRATGPVDSMSPAKRQALRDQRAPRALVAVLNGRRAPGVGTRDLTVPTPDGEVAIRVYRPTAAAPGTGLPTVVVLHGGGFVFGNLDSADWLCSSLAAAVPAVVVAVDYRLAPEHRAPAAHRDALAVTRWVAAHAADVGGRADRLAVVGESSGATLAASVALAARDDGGPAIALQALIYPMTDLTLSSPSISELPHEPILRAADVRTYVRLYLGDHARGTDPALSPLLAGDHGGVAPALVVTADHDPLRDDGRRYAERLARDGVPVQHVEYADSPHGFLSFPTICPAAAPALDTLTRALRRALVPSPASTEPVTARGERH